MMHGKLASRQSSVGTNISSCRAPAARTRPAHRSHHTRRSVANVDTIEAAPEAIAVQQAPVNEPQPDAVHASPAVPVQGTPGHNQQLQQQQRTMHSSSSSGSGSSVVTAPTRRQTPPLQAQAPRPFIPELNMQRALDILFGENKADPSVKWALDQAVVTDGGPPRLFSPRLPRGPDAAYPSTLPLMFYMPGIDGTGLAAYRQFPSLTRAFDLRCLLVPAHDRTPFEELVEMVAGMIQTEVLMQGAGRPVYVMGESFGGVMSLALAARLGDLVDRVVIINPATSFADSAWPIAGPLLTALPQEAYNLLPFALAPLLSNPLTMAAHDVDTTKPLPSQASDLLYGLLDLAPQLGVLRLVLPKATLAWRLQLLATGGKAVTPLLPRVQQRVLLLAGEKDLLIPSDKEAKRLAKLLPRCVTKVLPDRSHAMLQEAGVDLVELMKDEGFYVQQRVLSNGMASTSVAGGGASFGRAVPIQLPTTKELERDTAQINGFLRRVVSPVFYSTDAQGRVVRGLGAVPHGRPLLFVGNHQFAAPDMWLHVEEFLRERGTLLRGMAHPIIFNNAAAGGPGANPDDSNRNPGAASRNRDGAGIASFGNFLRTYGAVPVSGRNLFALLKQGEAVLLYPGGAREAFKPQNSNYKLFWPEQSEFVRMAAKFGATIVPFGAIGADEGVTQVLDAKQLESLPFLKNLPLGGGGMPGSIPPARRGVNATLGDETEAFMQRSFIVPNVPKRFYFVFQKPIETTPDMANDREACAAVYKTVKSEVEGGLAYLLRMREQDPYKELVPRLLYEASWGGKRQAPSFEP